MIPFPTMRMRSVLGIVCLMVLAACVDGGNTGGVQSGGSAIATAVPDKIGQGVTRPAIGDPLVRPGQRIAPARGGTQPSRAGVQGPPAAQADAFARNFLNSIQAQSFRERRELCGYFLWEANGQISATRPIPGTFATCEQPAPVPGDRIFASYHTHGAFAPQYDNEVPSATDLLSDFEFGLDGYVSTPGGRVWRIEFDTQDTLQICGRGCVAVDPGFVPQGEPGILPRFNLAQLQRRNGPL